MFYGNGASAIIEMGFSFPFASLSLPSLILSLSLRLIALPGPYNLNVLWFASPVSRLSS